MESIGFAGLGVMGGGMAANLLKAGYAVTGYDLDEEAMDRFAKAGGGKAPSAGEVVKNNRMVLSSLTDSETSVKVAEEVFLPRAREGQVFIELGTVAPPEQRRLAAAFAEKGAALLDAPVTGGAGGAAAGTLRVFAAGAKETFESCRPVFEAIGDPRHVHYCGSAGSGQVVKAVNQLGMGLVNAALLEAISFGINAGLPAALLREAAGGESGWRRQLSELCDAVERGDAVHAGIKAIQYPYFLDEAESRNFQLPVTRALRDFLRDAPLVTSEANRPSPSFWKELTGQ